MNLTNDAVLDLLTSVGPMTSSELHLFFPLRTHRHVSGVVSRMRLRGKEKRVRICSWVEVPGSGGKLAPVYEASGAPCRPRPRKTNAEKCKAWRDKQKAPRPVASVWELGSKFAE